MIDARELRIGNIVEPITMSPIMVTGITQQKTVDVIFTLIFVDYGESFLQEHLNPVELLEEGRIKFGFVCEKCDHNFNRQWDMPRDYDIDDVGISVGVNGDIEMYMNSGEGWIPVKIKWVHQLQNIYFFVMGKELTIQHL